MMKSFWLATAAASVAAATPAHADVLDMAAITCRDLMNMKSDDAATIMIWVHGFYGGKADDTKLDLDAFHEAITRIANYCNSRPKVSLLSAVKDVLK